MKKNLKKLLALTAVCTQGMAGVAGASGHEPSTEANVIDTMNSDEFSEAITPSSVKKLTGPQIGGLAAGGVGLVALLLGGGFWRKKVNVSLEREAKPVANDTDVKKYYVSLDIAGNLIIKQIGCEEDKVIIIHNYEMSEYDITDDSYIYKEAVFGSYNFAWVRFTEINRILCSIEAESRKPPTLHGGPSWRNAELDSVIVKYGLRSAESCENIPYGTPLFVGTCGNLKKHLDSLREAIAGDSSESEQDDLV